MARSDPTRSGFSTYGFSCVRWTATTMPRCDRHNEIELNLLERGELVYLMGGRRVVVSAGRLTAFWAGIPHQVLSFERLSEYFVLTIPLAWFLQWRLPDHFTQPILHGATMAEPDAGQLAPDRARFEQWNADLLSGSEDRRHASLLEIEARLRRLALGVTSDPPQSPHQALPGEVTGAREGRARGARGTRGQGARAALDQEHLSRAEQMACFIALNYTEPLTAQAIGKHVGLHPNYAMALFQRAFGTTLIRYVTQHRLSHAQRLLVTTPDSILSIAFDSGFGSLSRFNEAFRQSFGCTPRQYRRLHQLA